MNKYEKLRKLKNLSDEYFSTWNVKEQYQLGFIFMQDANWLLAQAERAMDLEAALKFYANEENYEMNEQSRKQQCLEIMWDRGLSARRALEESEWLNSQSKSATNRAKFGNL